MRRLAKDRRIFFVEPPGRTAGPARAVVTRLERNLHTVAIELPREASPWLAETEHRRCIAALAKERRIVHPVLWVYAPEHAHAARDVDPSVLVYDCAVDPCADPKSAAETRVRETELLARADVVFTATDELFEAKRSQNVSTYPLPSSVDREHFQRARDAQPGSSPRRGPVRAGYLGPIDRRVDLALLDRLARRPGLEIVLLGPLVGLREQDLPCRDDLRWLGDEPYESLPEHLATWDVGLVPWVVDDETHALLPSCALAYLSAGLPLVATPVASVERAYAARGLARVAVEARFADAVFAAAKERRSPPSGEIDALLGRTSWDRTVKTMWKLVGEAALARVVASGLRASCEA